MKKLTYSNTTVGMEDTLFAMQQKNLVYNGEFNYFSNQQTLNGSVEFNHPDGWVYENKGDGAQIASYDNACRIVVNSNGNNMCIKQALHEFPRWKERLISKKITLNAVMLLQEATSITVSLEDGVSSSSHSLLTNKTDEYLFELQLNVNEKATGLWISISSSTKGVPIQIQNVYANIGNVALPTLPCMVDGIIGERKQYIATQTAPCEELSLCEASYELSKNYTRLNSVLNKHFGVGENGFSLMPDVRGYFSRSWNNQSNIDPDANTRTAFNNSKIKGDKVGTLEEDIFKEHQHELVFSASEITIGEGAPANGLNLVQHSKSQPEGGKETRPKNFSELYTIKWS